MRKMVFGLSLSLASLAFLMSPVSPAVAAPSPLPAAVVLSVADQDFLASLAALPAGAPAPELEAKRPAIDPKSLCMATAHCGGGVTVTCSSNTSVSSCSAADRNCNAERGHVTCDGVTTQCAAACPGCPPNYCTQEVCDTACGTCDGTLICNPSTCIAKCKCDFINC